MLQQQRPKVHKEKILRVALFVQAQHQRTLWMVTKMRFFFLPFFRSFIVSEMVSYHSASGECDFDIIINFSLSLLLQSMRNLLGVALKWMNYKKNPLQLAKKQEYIILHLCSSSSQQLELTFISCCSVQKCAIVLTALFYGASTPRG